MGVPHLSFPRSARIKQSGGFARAKARGQRAVCGCLIANALDRSAGESTRLGIVTSKKVGQAVIRSRARRLLRETFRLHQHDLERPVDLVLVARPSIVGKSRQDVERDFLRAIRQLRLLSP
jgi:ribonuclease P protein component